MDDKFTTPDGNVWHLRVSPPTARPIRDVLGVDLLAIAAPAASNPLIRLADDPYLLADVMWALCKTAAEFRKMDREAFEDQLFQVIDAATQALIEAILWSFPEKKRLAIRRLLAAQDTALERVYARLETQTATAAIDAAVDDLLAKAHP